MRGFLLSRTRKTMFCDEKGRAFENKLTLVQKVVSSSFDIGFMVVEDPKPVEALLAVPKKVRVPRSSLPRVKKPKVPPVKKTFPLLLKAAEFGILDRMSRPEISYLKRGEWAHPKYTDPFMPYSSEVTHFSRYYEHSDPYVSYVRCLKCVRRLRAFVRNPKTHALEQPRPAKKLRRLILSNIAWERRNVNIAHDWGYCSSRDVDWDMAKCAWGKIDVLKSLLNEIPSRMSMQAARIFLSSLP